MITPEEAAQRLLAAGYAQPPAEIFEPDADAEALDAAKRGADLLVDARLATFADEGRTQIVPTGAGRYWALHGGYLAFLKEEPSGRGGGGRARNPELEMIRLELMRRRLGTFWYSFGLSLAGFLFSLLSLAVALFYGDRLLR
ncbi:MAG: hypothetical protein Q7J32_07140 [Sphingomonadaceae bacterium]|nr:hypothetical protein [Sphingomonadaceae bacterium]